MQTKNNNKTIEKIQDTKIKQEKHIKKIEKNKVNIQDPFENDIIYHIYNKTIDNKVIFQDKYNCNLFLRLLFYYRSDNSYLSFSKFNMNHMGPRAYQEYYNIIVDETSYRADILAYCLMPNHFHLLIKQNTDFGILKFISNVLNAFTKNYNTKEKRLGNIFLSKFKNTVVDDINYFCHVSRYIHLNPYSSNIGKTKKDILQYPWSSMKDYVKENTDLETLTDTKFLLDIFNNDRKEYIDFVVDYAEDQKEMKELRKELEYED